jgi:hypothetical protein
VCVCVCMRECVYVSIDDDEPGKHKEYVCVCVCMRECVYRVLLTYSCMLHYYITHTLTHSLSHTHSHSAGLTYT